MPNWSSAIPGGVEKKELFEIILKKRRTLIVSGYATRAMLGWTSVLGKNRNIEKCSEKELAARAAKGNKYAFSLIVKRYQSPVYNLCYRYVGPSEAEDTAQETFMRAFVHKDRFDPERPLLPWLLTIAKRLCIDRIRKTKREVVSSEEAEVLPDTAPTSDVATSQKQELEILAHGLKKLPEGQREAIALYHINELSYEEVASTLDVPIGTVMTWLHRGRAKLREILEKENRNNTPRGVR